MYTRKTKISEVINDEVFGDYGRLIFPVESAYYSGDTLENLKLTWYNNIDPDTTVEIVNYMKSSVMQGKTIFYDIYSDEEKEADPDKEDTGLFFFKGNEGEKFAVCNAGGAFAYVGAMQDSFPHALELSKQGYNAFALIYRPGAQTACEDLSRALTFIFEHAEELGVSTDNYSLWGGSAGARMAAWVGRYGTAAFGEPELPKPAAVVMQYTGLGDYSRNDPPTFVTVGESDGIANWRIMKQRLDAMSKTVEADATQQEGKGGENDLRDGTSTDIVAALDDFLAAAALRELGFQTFIVDYRLQPYTQQEGALDVARAVRFIRKNADVYGTEDPFYNQFEKQYDVIKGMGIETGRIVLNGWPHGFGSDGGWVRDYADWLETIFHKE